MSIARAVVKLSRMSGSFAGEEENVELGISQQAIFLPALPVF